MQHSYEKKLGNSDNRGLEKYKMHHGWHYDVLKEVDLNVLGMQWISHCGIQHPSRGGFLKVGKALAGFKNFFYCFLCSQRDPMYAYIYISPYRH